LISEYILGLALGIRRLTESRNYSDEGPVGPSAFWKISNEVDESRRVSDAESLLADFGDDVDSD